MKIKFKIVLSALILMGTWAQADKPRDHGRLEVSSDGHMLQHHNDKKGFFWMGDTAWDLSHKLQEGGVDTYLQDRANKHYSVIQIVAMHYYDKTKIEFAKDPYGNLPLKNSTLNLNNAYWNHIDYIINKAEEKGLYIALLPFWGDWFSDEDQTSEYATNVANRYCHKKNIIWVVGGDIDATEDSPQRIRIVNAAANAIRAVESARTDCDKHLMTVHVGQDKSSSKGFGNEEWLDFNMVQSSHCPARYLYPNETGATGYIKHDYTNEYMRYDSTLGNKPVIDGEPMYEKIVKCYMNGETTGAVTSNEVRRMAYQQLFSGAFGHTYGNVSLSQMYRTDDNDTPEYKDNNMTRYIDGVPATWDVALNHSGSKQMQHVADLMTSRPILGRKPYQDLIVGGEGIATLRKAKEGKDSQGDYAFIYVDKQSSITVDMELVSKGAVKATWYNPRSGWKYPIGIYKHPKDVTIGTRNAEQDWILILDGIPGSNDDIPITYLILN